MLRKIAQEQNWLELLPEVRGRYSFDADLSSVTWFRVGGKASVVYRPADIDDLCQFMSQRQPEVPVFTLGVGSNLLVRDGGIQGVVIRLMRGFADIAVEGDTIHAGAGALDGNVARMAVEAGLGGLEFLSGIPGTIGGALRMNAGAYGREMKDILLRAIAVDGSGRVHHLTKDDMGFTYRHSAIPPDWVFVGAVLQGAPEKAEIIARRMMEIKTQREATQPVKSRTGGSTFTNPPGQKAWQLIEDAGCRGLKHGQAQISELHCNFLINLGGASAMDLENLGEEVRTRVLAKSGIELNWEIMRIGSKL
ncbi:MAG: UDP-N-acetylmuramate dehydrogenase [Dongiaceae bacterium]